MNVASANLANVSTTQGADGGPYKRQSVVLKSIETDGNVSGAQASGSSGSVRGVAVESIQRDDQPPRLEYDPGHPDADINGYVAYPNVNMVEEMVDMITASRAYEAGITALGTAVSMAERALMIGK
jgi:flagellar basal-body rod protein FlgC